MQIWKFSLLTEERIIEIILPPKARSKWTTARASRASMPTLHLVNHEASAISQRTFTKCFGTWVNLERDVFWLNSVVPTALITFARHFCGLQYSCGCLEHDEITDEERSGMKKKLERITKLVVSWDLIRNTVELGNEISSLPRWTSLASVASNPLLSTFQADFAHLSALTFVYNDAWEMDHSERSCKPLLIGALLPLKYGIFENGYWDMEPRFSVEAILRIIQEAFSTTVVGEPLIVRGKSWDWNVGGSEQMVREWTWGPERYARRSFCIAAFQQDWRGLTGAPA